MLLALLLFACTTDTDTATDTDVTDTDVTDTDTAAAAGWPDCADFAGTETPWPDCRNELAWDASCEGEWPAAPSQEGLLFAGEGYLEGESISAEIAYAWTDAGSWDAFVAGWPEHLERPAPVDFATHQVVGVKDYFGSYCDELRVDAHGIDGGRLYARFTDTAGTCEVACDTEVTLWVLYAVPRDAVPVICAEERNTCEM